MLLFIEDAIREGISKCSNRFGLTNNKYMPDYNKSKSSKYLFIKTAIIYIGRLCRNSSLTKGLNATTTTSMLPQFPTIDQKDKYCKLTWNILDIYTIYTKISNYTQSISGLKIS